jgi:hypothetical protein
MAAPSKVQIFEVSPLALLPDASVTRVPARPLESRQPSYEEEFDFHTLFYDVFRCGRVVRLVGPPMVNLEESVINDLAASNDLTPNSVRTHDFGMVQRSSIKGLPRQGGTFAFRHDGLDSVTTLGADLAPLFAHRRVLLTLSKDNDLAWIGDWARFHARTHGVDTVVLYDNGSTRYTMADLQATLNEVSEISLAAIVLWPFPYGPQGGPDNLWDSNFCQYGMLEHAKWRLLRRAFGVINADIDELVITPHGATAFDAAARTSHGVVEYEGTWIARVPFGPEPQSTYSRYGYTDVALGSSEAKWCLLPRRAPRQSQWRVHDVVWGRKASLVPPPQPWRALTKAPEVAFRHFLALNTGWRWSRGETTEYEPDRHVVDEALRAALAEVEM